MNEISQTNQKLSLELKKNYFFSLSRDPI